jgi:membrane-associated phospholipid phosphatase
MVLKQKPSFALLLSVIFHPILWAFYMLTGLSLLFDYIFPSTQQMLIFLGATFLLMVAFPILMFWILMKFKIISSLQIDDRRERILPLFLVGVSYYFLHLLMKSMAFPQSFQLFFLGATFILLVCMMITSFWKISIHVLAVGATTGALLALGFRYQIVTFPVVIPCLLIAGLLGYARLKLEAHTPAQVYSGFAIGLISMFLLFVLL